MSGMGIDHYGDQCDCRSSQGNHRNGNIGIKNLLAKKSETPREFPSFSL
jgi:hypothetical protein